MKAFRHKRGARKASQRKQIAKNGSKKFQMESLETRVLLSDTSMTMLPLELPNENPAPPDAPLVLFADQTSSPMETAFENPSSPPVPSSPTSKEGQTLDVAFNS